MKIKPSAGGGLTPVAGGGVTFPSGQILAPDGSVAAPSYSFADDTTTGWYQAANTSIQLALGGTQYLYFDGGGPSIRAGEGQGYRLGGVASSPDVILTRDAVNILALKNAANPQVMRVYRDTTTYVSISGLDGIAIPLHASAPATPAAGYVVLYAKADKKLYAKNDAGTETVLY